MIKSGRYDAIAILAGAGFGKSRLAQSILRLLLEHDGSGPASAAFVAHQGSVAQQAGAVTVACGLHDGLFDTTTQRYTAAGARKVAALKVIMWDEVQATSDTMTWNALARLRIAARQV